MAKNKYSKIVAALLAAPLLIGGVAPMNVSAIDSHSVTIAYGPSPTATIDQTINVGETIYYTSRITPFSDEQYFSYISCRVSNESVLEKVSEKFFSESSLAKACYVKGVKAGTAKVYFTALLDGTNGKTLESDVATITVNGPNASSSSSSSQTTGDPTTTTTTETTTTTTSGATSTTVASSSAKIKAPKINSLKASSKKINPGETATVTVSHTGSSLTWTVTDKKGALESTDCKENSNTCTIVAKDRVAAKSSVKVTAVSKSGSGSNAKTKKKSVTITVKKSDLTPEYAEEVAAKADQFAAQAASATIGTVDGYSPKSMKAALKKAFKKAGYKDKVFNYNLASTGQPAWFGHANQINWNDQAMRMIAYRMVKNSKTYTDGEITKFLNKEKFGESYINYVISHRAELINSVKVPDLDSVKSAIVEALMSQKGLSQSDAETYVNAHVK